MKAYHRELGKHLRELDNTPKSKKLARHSPKPYWLDDLTELWKLCHEAEKAYEKADCKSPVYIGLKERSNRDIKKARWSFERKKVYELEEANVNNPTEFWRLIQKLGPKKKASKPWAAEDTEGNVINDTETVLGTWRKDFKGLLTPPDDDTQEQKAFVQNIINDNRRREQERDFYTSRPDLNSDFIEDEVEKIVRKSKTGKAPGLPLNYRGISLLSIVGKLYTAAISARINKFLETNDKLCNEQNGFRPERSCLDHIFTLIDTCKIRKNLRQRTFLSFIDFQKAFDYVNHNLLYHKLLNIGIKGDLYQAIRAIYECPSSCVQVGGLLTDWFTVSSRVRQGDSLSPTLFAIYINDLYMEVAESGGGVKVGGENLHMLLYADDIVLISSSTDAAQHQLNTLSN